MKTVFKCIHISYVSKWKKEKRKKKYIRFVIQYTIYIHWVNYNLKMYFVFIFVCYLYYIYIFFTKHILYPLEVFIKLFNIEFLRVFIIYILWQCRVDVIINNIRIFSTFFIPEITTRIKICPVSCIFCVRSHNTKAVIIKSSSYLYSA